MSEAKVESKFSDLPKVKYQNAFFYGVVGGIILSVVSRLSLKEWASAWPFSYFKVSLSTGLFTWYYDYQRRLIIEKVLHVENDSRMQS